jgi:hypothetical protein
MDDERFMDVDGIAAQDQWSDQRDQLEQENPHALRLAKRADDLEAENERLRADVAELSADVYKCAEERDEAYADARRYQERLNRVVEARRAELDACEEMRRASMERCARRSEKALIDIDADRNRAVSAYLATVKERDQARREAQVWERAAHAAQQRHDDGLIAFNDELEQRIRVMQEVAATLLGEASECAEAGEIGWADFLKEMAGRLDGGE